MSEPAKSKLLPFIDTSSMVLSILMLTGGIKFIKILAVIAYPTSIAFLFLYWKKTIWTIIQEKWFWLYLGAIVISLSWSIDRGVSLYSTLKLIGTLLIGISLAVRYHLKDQLKILAWTFGISALLSLVYGLVLPNQGIMAGTNLQGSWSGIYSHKNVLGRMMVMSSMVFFLLSLEATAYRWLLRSFLALSIALVILSTSKTALLVLITLLLLFPLYRALRWSYTLIIPFVGVFIIATSTVCLLLVSQADYILAALGKDATLTGRVPLWELVIAKIGERPWLGYGYDAFWQGLHGEANDIFLQLSLADINWQAHHSHNGFLDVWLAFGLFGVVIATLAFFSILLRSLACIRSTNSAYGFWPLWYLTLLFLVSVTESNMNSFAIYWAFNIAIAISTHQKILNCDRHTSFPDSSTTQHTPTDRLVNSNKNNVQT